jgi:orotidine-5'-phosphate decarboxylase
MTNTSRLIVALDFSAEAEALAMAALLDPSLCKVKVGKELFTVAGPSLVRRLVAMGFDVFLDLKFHDIPNTVAKACRAAASLGVWMINVHASGGRDMMVAARAAIEAATPRPLLIAVTVLTSLSDEAVREIGFAASAAAQASRLARLTHASGLDGVVCSVHEVADIKGACGAKFLTVTPGIRFADDAKGDQVRVATPQFAREQGADYLVMGRPITQAPNPRQRLLEVERTLQLLKDSKA